MVCISVERPAEKAGATLLQRLARLGRQLVWSLAQPDRLDLDSMPDRVKRDLGFMDGRDPFYEDEPRLR
jgi:hypothetical protein